jgi:hypothetical protein
MGQFIMILLIVILSLAGLSVLIGDDHNDFIL